MLIRNQKIHPGNIGVKISPRTKDNCVKSLFFLYIMVREEGLSGSATFQNLVLAAKIICNHVTCCRRAPLRRLYAGVASDYYTVITHFYCTGSRLSEEQLLYLKCLTHHKSSVLQQRRCGSCQGADVQISV